MARRRQTNSAAYQTNNDENPPVSILGANLEPDAGFQEAVQETEEMAKKRKTMIEHRNRIKHIYEFWIDKCPEYAYTDINTKTSLLGIVKLTDEQKQDRSSFHYKNTHDLVYQGINIKYVKAFLGQKKKKENGKTCSHVNIRKYHDAILFGAEKARVSLSPLYLSEMKKFLLSFKKETKQAKVMGDLDEENADPIPWALFVQICHWALLSGNIFVWVFSVMQWNCLGRSVSIDPLGFHNFLPGVDSIIVQYDNSKADQEGMKVTPKNCYANPFDPRVSFHLAIGCWLCLNQEVFGTTEKLFLANGCEIGSAAARYSCSLRDMLKDKINEIQKFMDPKKCTSHGTRKGGAIQITTGTTHPPPIPSVAARGEWSIGQVLQLYWQFGDAGDCYAGRILAGLDHEDPSFEVLPPHFACGMENVHVAEAMQLCFGAILDGHAGIEWLLLLLLASIVHHSDFLQATKDSVPNHPFANISILRRPELLVELRKLVSMKPTDRIPNATGIPPHVKELGLMKDTLHTCGETLQVLKDMIPDMKECIAESIQVAAEDFAQSNGHVTSFRLEEMFNTFEKKILDEINKTGIQTQRTAVNGDRPPTQAFGFQNLLFGSYEYDGRADWQVPQDFTFPASTQRRAGWDLWLKGDPSHRSSIGGEWRNTPVRPYRLMDPKNLPLKL